MRKGKQMKTVKKVLIGIIVLILFGLGFFFGKKFIDSKKEIGEAEGMSGGISSEKQVTMKESFPAKAQKISFADGKNFFTIPGKDNIVQTEIGEYVDGQILVDVDLEKFDEKTFEKYGASIIARCDIWGGYEIYIADKSLNQLEVLAEDIGKEEGVLLSQVHWIVPSVPNEYSYPDDDFSVYPDEGLSPFNIFKYIFKKNNKTNLWDNYSIEDGYRLISENADLGESTDDPYWSYKATNLPYMWKNLENKKEVNVGVFENTKLKNNVSKDLSFENWESEDYESKYAKSTYKKLRIIDDISYRVREGIEKINSDSKKSTKPNYRDHTANVCSLIGARHNDIGFSGVCKNAKVFPIPYPEPLLPYLLAYRISNPDNPANIFSISMGYKKAELYAINYDESLEEDSRNDSLKEYLELDKSPEEFIKEVSKIREDHNYSKLRLNMALRALKNAGKDFLIVKCAGNEGEKIAKIEKYTRVKIEKTTIFDELDPDLKDHVIIVGASRPKFSNGKTFFSDISTTRNVDIVGPGKNIPGYDDGGHVVMWGGTSAATPFVAGLAANLYGAYPEKMNGPLAKKLILASGNLEVLDVREERHSKLVDAKILTDLVKDADLDDMESADEEDEVKSSKYKEKISFYQEHDDPELAADRRDFIKNVLNKTADADFKESEIYLVKKKEDSSYYLVTKDSHSKYALENYKVYVALPNADLSEYRLIQADDFIPDEKYSDAFADFYIYNFYDPDKDKFTDYLFLFRDHGGNTVGDYTIRAIALDGGRIHHIEELKDSLAYKDLIYTKNNPQGLLNGFNITLEPRAYHNIYIKHDFNNYDRNFRIIDQDRDENVSKAEKYDTGFVKLYRDIINSKAPYYKYENQAKYINEVYYNHDLKFGICKVDDFKYPLLVLSATNDGYNWYSIIQYTGDNKYNTCLYIEPAQVDLCSNYVYTYEGKHIFMDNQGNDDLYFIGKNDGKIQMTYGYSPTIQGPADIRIDLAGIDRKKAKAFDKKDYDKLKSKLKPVKMYPINDKTFMDLIDKYKDDQKNEEESIYSLYIKDVYTNTDSYHDLSVIDKDSLHFMDVNALNEYSMENSPYLTDPQYKEYKDKYIKVLEENNGKYIKKNKDGSFYFGFYPGNVGMDDENSVDYEFQYFPEYGVTFFAYKDYMKEDEVYYLKSPYPGIVANDNLYLEADFLAWWIGFEYQIDPSKKSINMNLEGHDIGQEGVDYVKIPTGSYKSMKDLLNDNFEKIK